MHELLLVLNVKASGFVANVFDLRGRSVVKNVASLLIFGGVAIGVFLLSRSVTAYLLQQAHIGHFLYHRFLSMMLYVFFLTVNLGNIIVCYATLFRSDEVRFLMGLPVSFGKIFAIKFVDNFFYSSSTLTMLGMAWLFGYGSYFHMPWHFYLLTMFAVMLPFMLIAGLAAVVTLVMLIRVASRVGIRWLVAGVIVAYLLAVYLYFAITSPVQMVEQVMRHYPNVNEYFGYLDAPLVRYLPNHWVAEFLYWTVLGDAVRAFPHLLVLLLALATLVLATGYVARRYYYPTWVAAGDAAAMGGTGRPLLRLRFLEFGRRPALSSPADVIARRDFWMFVREPSQWLHLLLMLLLLVIFLASVSSLDMKMSQPFMRAVTFLVVFLFNGFLVASISLRFVFPAVSLEGEAFWAVRSAPVTPRALYWRKFWFLFGAVFLVAETLAVVSIGLIRDNPSLVILSAAATGCVALALTSLNLGAGAAFAAYREKNPIRVASTQGASLTFLVSMLYLGIVVAVILVPLSRYFESMIYAGDQPATWTVAPILAIGVLSATVFAVSTRTGLRAIARDF